MRVILLKDVKKVGRRFEEKEVADGYARNFLVPQKLAVPTGSPAAKQALDQRNREEVTHEKQEGTIRENISKLSGATLIITVKANEQGHLFEKLTAEKICALIQKEKGLKINPSYLEIEPIKQTGIHEIPIKIGDKETRFTLEIAPLN